MKLSSLSPPHAVIAEALRSKIRRGVDLAAFIGASLGAIIGIADVTRGTTEPPIALAVMVSLAACGLLGLIGRARWTPIAYVALIMIANVIYLASYGTWFGLGAVYVLAIAIAFLFLSTRWAWIVGMGLVTTPVVLGLLIEARLIDGARSIDLDDPNTWRRAALAAITAFVGIAIIVSYAVRQLLRERREIESAFIHQREQRIERERLEGEIARVRRTDTIAQLAAEVGADIGAALAIIQARARALAGELTGTDAKDCLSDIAEATSNAGSTMRSLTVFAPGSTPSTRGNASEAVRALPKLVRRMIPATIALETTADDDAWVGIGTTDLSRICANLVLNARDAIAETGTISVRVVREAAHVLIEVRDTGIGMTEETLSHMFQPFFTTKPVGRGTGLGLATTKILVERASGTIGVASELGQGSTFSIRLPLLGEPA